MNVNYKGGLLQLLLESPNLGAQLRDLLVARVAVRLAASLLAQGTKRTFLALAGLALRSASLRFRPTSASIAASCF